MQKKTKKTVDNFTSNSKEFYKALSDYRAKNGKITVIDFTILLIEKALNYETSK